MTGNPYRILKLQKEIIKLQKEIIQLNDIIRRITNEVELFEGPDKLCVLGELLRDNILEILNEKEKEDDSSS